ncbi:Zinc finger protein 19 like protein [Argiope bruennichi]|uniref:Zinc finger protein 19 like protein n=1 Tax=Argiope bruennichi TaxID=94029 RepID=A0A8T0F8R3_ARGBR|nr:Zinc finger protein 19 like protein [Argiope bruennichi]
MKPVEEQDYSQHISLTEVSDMCASAMDTDTNSQTVEQEYSPLISLTEVSDMCVSAMDTDTNSQTVALSDENTFSCNTCGKIFSQKNYLKVHLRTHVSENAFICDVCKKTFSQKRYLRRHVCIHTNEEVYPFDAFDKEGSLDLNKQGSLDLNNQVMEFCTLLLPAIDCEVMSFGRN